MSKNKYKISGKKLNKALELLALKEMSDSAIAQEVGISRNTLKRIKDDPEHQELFKTESESSIKMASHCYNWKYVHNCSYLLWNMSVLFGTLDV